MVETPDGGLLSPLEMAGELIEESDRAIQGRDRIDWV
jgi:hypothetical protein